MITRNSVRCRLCGDEIESKHRHDFVGCSCGAVAVDGGHDYLRRVFDSSRVPLDELPYEDTSLDDGEDVYS